MHVFVCVYVCTHMQMCVCRAVPTPGICIGPIPAIFDGVKYVVQVPILLFVHYQP